VIKGNFKGDKRRMKNKLKDIHSLLERSRMKDKVLDSELGVTPTVYLANHISRSPEFCRVDFPGQGTLNSFLTRIIFSIRSLSAFTSCITDVYVCTCMYILAVGPFYKWGKQIPSNVFELYVR
jgi:hypothetical protein